MSDVKHTAEPWRVECDKFDKNYHNPNSWPRLFSGEFEICGAEGFYSESLKQDKENARRIVACVNYCDGADTNALELDTKTGRTASVALPQLTEKVIALESQRDQLLEAAIAAYDLLKIIHDETGKVGMQLKEAIAAVKGEK